MRSVFPNKFFAKPAFAGPVFNFNNPEIGVAAFPALQNRQRVAARLEALAFVKPAPLPVIVNGSPRRGPQQADRAVQAVNDNKNGSRLLRPFFRHGGKETAGKTAADEG